MQKYYVYNILNSSFYYQTIGEYYLPCSLSSIKSKLKIKWPGTTSFMTELSADGSVSLSKWTPRDEEPARANSDVCVAQDAYGCDCLPARGFLVTHIGAGLSLGRTTPRRIPPEEMASHPTPTPLSSLCQFVGEYIRVIDRGRQRHANSGGFVPGREESRGRRGTALERGPPALTLIPGIRLTLFLLLSAELSCCWCRGRLWKFQVWAW